MNDKKYNRIKVILAEKSLQKQEASGETRKRPVNNI